MNLRLIESCHGIFTVYRAHHHWKVIWKVLLLYLMLIYQTTRARFSTFLWNGNLCRTTCDTLHGLIYKVHVYFESCMQLKSYLDGNVAIVIL